MFVFKKLICLLIIITFSSTTLFAQTSAQSRQIQKYLETPEGQKFLKSAQGQKLLEENTEKFKGEEFDELKEEIESEATLEAEKEEEFEPFSKLEMALSKDLMLAGKEPLRQYGYDIFKSTVASFIPPDDVAVGPNYIIGPGDSFNVTLWGITEGIFNVEVNREGGIVLPKVGVVKVVGLTYGELKPFIEQQLGRYYESVNVGITIDELRTIQVYVVGEVTQPGSYTLSSLSTAFNALFAAGGPTKKGSLRKIQILRSGRVIAALDLYRFLLKGDKSQDRNLRSGDTIFVPIIGPVAGIAGAVFRPAIYEIKGKADLGDFIYLAGGFLPTGYLNRVQVKRILAHEKRIVRDENISRNRSSQKFGITLQNMDLVEVFPIFGEVRNMVYVEGEVKYPGSYELKNGTRIKDVLPSPAAFTFNAYLPHVEVVRIDPDTREIKILAVDFEKLYGGDKTQNILLQSLDRVVVSSEKREEGKITLSGEVMRPGIYTFAPGEKLSSVLKRAGGFTKDAYLFGAKFTRESVKNAQEAQGKALISRLREDTVRRGREIISGALSEEDRAAKEAQLVKSEELLKLLEERTMDGRVIVQLEYPLEDFARSKDDIELEDEDVLHIPMVSKVVLVLGEVYNPSSVIYDSSQNVKYYLRQVGGPNKNADAGSVYIIRADGSVISRDQRVNVMATKLYPGDSIIVPQLLETFNFWSFFKDWTHWFYEMAIAFAIIATYLR